MSKLNPIDVTFYDLCVIRLGWCLARHSSRTCLFSIINSTNRNNTIHIYSLDRNTKQNSYEITTSSEYGRKRMFIKYPFTLIAITRFYSVLLKHELRRASISSELNWFVNFIADISASNCSFMKSIIRKKQISTTLWKIVKRDIKRSG